MKVEQLVVGCYTVILDASEIKQIDNLEEAMESPGSSVIGWMLTRSFDDVTDCVAKITPRSKV